MRARNAAWLCALAFLASVPVRAAPPEDPPTFALVAAMGDLFSAVSEVPTVGSHLAPYRRRTIEVKDDAINRIVLKGLGDAVLATDPEAKRVYLSVRLPREMQDRPALLEDAAFDRVVEELRRMPRGEWHRIVVATPAYRAAARDGLAGGMEGLGLFTQPLCKGDVRACDTRSRPATGGTPARTPSGETETASRYVAPFLFAKIRILDPRTLEVIDVQEVFDHEKLFDPDSGAMDMNRSIDRKTLASRVLARVEASALEAVRRSELRGRVDVQERGAVPAPR